MYAKHEHMEMRGFGWRVALSILVSMGWVAFLIIWLFFYAGSFTIYQNVAVVLVSIVVGCAIMGAAWAPWGMRHGHSHGKGWECCTEAERKKAEKAEKPAEKPRSRKRKRSANN
jgi:hypothetical protein